MIKDAIYGLVMGDTLGVPVEFKSRSSLNQNPVTDMTGYGTYNQPPGTWSDDSSLALCLAEGLIPDFDINMISQNFVKWLHHNYWTPHGEVFDVGISTRKAITNLSRGIAPELAGGFEVDENGNGSLMRILPLLFYIKDKEIGERYQIIKQVSSITHGHVRSVIGCFYYLEFARQLLNKKDKFTVYQNLKYSVSDYLNSILISETEIGLFGRLLIDDIHEFPVEKINSSGYVLHTLEASIWCLLTTNDYRSAVLKAINLGEDTDTTGAVTGGIAGLLYGFNNIPGNWVEQLARKKDIDDLVERLSAQY